MIVRDAKIADATELLELMAQIDSETDFMLFEAGERVLDVSKQKKMLQEVDTNADLYLLVAEDEGQLLGYLGMTRLKQRRVKHIAKLVCGVANQASGRGIGKSLLQAAIQRAQDSGVTRIELTVAATNHRARKLYEKLGFELEGYRKQSLRIENTLQDECYMALLLT